MNSRELGGLPSSVLGVRSFFRRVIERGSGATLRGLLKKFKKVSFNALKLFFTELETSFKASAKAVKGSNTSAGSEILEGFFNCSARFTLRDLLPNRGEVNSFSN